MRGYPSWLPTEPLGIIKNLICNRYRKRFGKMTDAMRWLLVVLMVSVAVVGVVLNVEAGNKVVVIPLFNDEAGATGDATMADVLEGRTFSNDSRMGLSGTMPNIGWQFITPGTTAKGIPAGYHNGTGEVAGDAELVPENIKNGVNIFGVAGTSVLASGTATPDQVLSGVTYSSVSGVSTGSMPNNGAVNITPGIIEQLIPSGYHGGMGLVAGDPDLVPDNIKKDVSIFGVTGTSVHASGTATDNMVLSGVTYSNTLGASTGSMPDNGAVNITPGIIEQLIPAG
jgi:hypothetical protein